MIIIETDGMARLRNRRQAAASASPPCAVLSRRGQSNSSALESVQPKALTDHFVLLPVPDGRAEQTLNLVTGVIWILPLSREHGRTRALNVGNKRGGNTQIKTGCTDCPGEALVLGHVCNVERLHGVLDILSIHVVDLADITVPAETHDIVMATERCCGQTKETQHPRGLALNGQWSCDLGLG